MSSEIAISVNNLGKCYQIYKKPHDRLLQMFAGRRKQYYREFWALKDVSFTIKKGESVGIIGRNGSGKSSLLQMICGTLNPTTGTIETQGRIAALLELGSGFNPEFTGRENVYLNASILGLSNEQINFRFNEIVNFADIGEYINQPVKTYSSGMLVRLAFAVIAHVDADILIIDEALSVGDIFFQQKCMRFLRAFQEKKGTLLFVSHDTSSIVNLCDKAILLIANQPGGQLGDTEQICKLYLENLYSDSERRNRIKANANVDEHQKVLQDNKIHVYEGKIQTETKYLISEFITNTETFGDRGATIISAGFCDVDGNNISSTKGGENVVFFIKANVHQKIKSPAFGFMIKNSLGEYIFAEGTDKHFRQHEIVFNTEDTVLARFSFTMPHLIYGKYSINVAIAEGVGDEHIQHFWKHDAIQLEVISGRLVHGYCGMNNMSMSIQVNA